MTKQFPLSQVLSVTTGRLCCEMSGVYEILNHITGDDLFTHVLPRACRFAEPLLLAAFPELHAAKAAPALDRFDSLLKEHGPGMKAVAEWIKWVRENTPIKDEYSIPSYADAWLSKDPLAELSQMVPPEKIVVVQAE